MDAKRQAVLAAIAKGATVEAAAQAVGVRPDSVWASLWKEPPFREAYKQALWTNCQAQLARLEALAIDLQGDPDTSDIDVFDDNERGTELALRARLADHSAKRRHCSQLLAHWRWRCEHLAPSLFGMEARGVTDVDALPDYYTGELGPRYRANGGLDFRARDAA